MADLRELQQKLASAKALREIVQAMRNLAAIYVRRAESTLDAIRPYSDATQTALSVVLQRLELGLSDTHFRGTCLALVFTGDQGLCGTFNERAVRALSAFTAEAGQPVQVACIGRRGHDLLVRRGIEPVLALRAPSSIEGIKARMPQLAVETFRAFSEAKATDMVFVYSTYEGMGRAVEQVTHILPPSLERLRAGTAYSFRADPLLTAPPAELLEPLVEEYFYIELYRALLESHASENGARLLAMTAAATNIDGRLLDLTRESQSLRQDLITAELLDVVGGAEALRE